MARRLLLVTAIVVLMLGMSVAAGRAELVLDFTGGLAEGAGAEAVAGWEFDVLSTIVINGLGFWDEGGDGLAGTHEIDLWNSDGSLLLASTTITNASTPVPSTSSDGRWLFNDIAPLALVPGTYVVGAWYGPDLIRFNASATTISEVTFVFARSSVINNPGFPIVPVPVNDGFFGPNLRTVDLVAAVPAPLSLALLGLGLAGIVIRRRSRPS